MNEKKPNYVGTYEDLLEQVVIVANRFDLTFKEALLMIYDGVDFWSFINLLERVDKTVENIYEDLKDTFIYRSTVKYCKANNKSELKTC